VTDLHSVADKKAEGVFSPNADTISGYLDG
jgi:hypothetical protein